MNFLQPWMLIALPLIAAPIIIHLVNQRRFQTVPWAAMMFLLQASRMSSGYSKLRQWLILALRTLAIAALILFTARPLASGLLGLMGNRTDEVAVVLLDRSPSMQQTQPGTGMTKQQSALQQLASTLQTLGVKRVAIFDSSNPKPIELETPEAIVSNVDVPPNGITSDMPGLMERALNYIKTNRFASTDVWICSDLRESDWRSRDGRWVAAREGFLSLAQEVRFHILDFGTVSEDNLAIRIVNAKRVEETNGPELSISFKLQRNTIARSDTSGELEAAKSPRASIQVPVEIEVGSVRSVLNVDLQSESADVNDYRIPLPSDQLNSNTESQNSSAGWGTLRIPADTNLADNASYFVFEKPPTRRSVIVSDNPSLIEAIELCTNIAPEQSIQVVTETVTSSQLDSVDWNSVSLVIWHEQLPTDRPLELLTRFVESGGQVLFLPPESPNETRAFGFRWTQWEPLQPQSNGSPSPIPNSTADSTATGAADSTGNGTADGASTSVATPQDGQASLLARIQQWRNDSSILGNTLNGAALPVGQIGIKRICRVEGAGTTLASVQDNTPFLLKMDAVDPDQTQLDSDYGVYVCTTTPAVSDSTLAKDGVVLYIAIQRVLAAGVERVGTSKMKLVGESESDQLEQATQMAGDKDAFSNSYPQHTGVYQTPDLLIAQNRTADEDSSTSLPEATIAELFGSLKWSRIQSGNNANSLVQEIWKWFVVAMLMALLLEAALSLPKQRATLKKV